MDSAVSTATENRLDTLFQIANNINMNWKILHISSLYSSAFCNGGWRKLDLNAQATTTSVQLL
jgi:hypothetical protein